MRNHVSPFGSLCLFILLSVLSGTIQAQQSASLAGPWLATGYFSVTESAGGQSEARILDLPSQTTQVSQTGTNISLKLHTPDPFTGAPLTNTYTGTVVGNKVTIKGHVGMGNTPGLVVQQDSVVASGPLVGGTVYFTNGTVLITGTRNGTAFTVQGKPHVTARAQFTLPPALSITAPAPGQRFTDQACTVTGTASGNAGVAGVFVRLGSNDWARASTSDSWAHWSANVMLMPGTNVVGAYAVDAQTNQSPVASVSCVAVISTPLDVLITGQGAVSPNYDHKPLVIWKAYNMAATGTNGFAFASWACSDGWVSNRSTVTFTMHSNLVLTANFKDITRPKLAITNLVNNQQVGSPSLFIKGWAKDNALVTNVQCRVGNGGWFSANGTTAWGTAFLGLLPGQTNTVNAYAQDSSGLCSLTSVVKVVYNQFLPVNGTYNGLFSASDSVSARMHESSGFLKLTVSGKGAYSGSFILAGKTNSLGTGTFDVNGHASKNVGTGANMVAVNLDLSLVPGSDTLTGTLSNSAWVAELQADRAVFVTTNKAPSAGKYTLVLPGAMDEGDTTTPLGVGYGAVTVNSLGQVVLSGSLADGTALSQGTMVSKYGWWPMYASLYGGKGSVWGWLQFTNGLPPDLLGGEVSWIKEVQPTMTKYYRLGFTNVLETQGSLYVAPSNATMRVIGLTNGVVSFVGGNVSMPFTNQVALGANNVVTNQGGNKLTVSLGKANGTFSGTVLVPGAKTSTTFKGAVLQDEAVGWGYFLGTNQSGRVYLGP